MNSLSQKETAPLPSLVKVRPMLMITGFLGAGKTTLLRELLNYLKTREILSDVILNDRENAYLDKATLVDHAADVAALTGSCVCCDGYLDLVDMILKASKSKHDALFIELNGTADPVPLQESFIALESKFKMHPRWQVCVIDARYFRKRRRYNDLESLQLETASHYYISWNSELTKEEESQLEEDIKAINSVATRTTAPLLADAISQAVRNNHGHAIKVQRSTENQGSLPKLDLGLQPKGKVHDRHHLAHEFTGCQILVPEQVEESCVLDWLEKLPESVIRAKALLTLNTDTERRYLYERVGQVVSPQPTGTRVIGKTPCSGIFIGAEIDPEQILSLTKEYLHPNCHFPESWTEPLS